MKFVMYLTVGTLAWAQIPAITTIAGKTPVNGNPVRGFSGDGGAAIEATLAFANLQNICDPSRFEQTSHLSIDSKGNLYFADSDNQRIRRIDAAGVITTVAGSGEPPQADSRCLVTGTVGDGNNPLAARFFNPADVILTSGGSVLIADQQNNRIRQITAAGAVSTISGSGLHNFYAPGIPATSSPMDWPSALALDSAGTLYFAELHSNRVGRLGADGRIATVAGTGFPGYNRDGIQATTATLTKPAGIAFDRAGNLLIADTGNHRIRRLDSGGVITTIAGNGQQSFCGDNGPATQSCLDTPMDVKADALGNIYIADTGNHRVRRIGTDGTITTVAGNGRQGRGADNVAATSSALNYPSSLAIDANNDVYFIDWQNYLIRKLTFAPLPAIAEGGIVNGASFKAAVAPGSLISIFGSNFAAATAVEVNGTVIPLVAITPGQINAQLPYEAGVGTASAVVVTPGGLSAAASFNVVQTAIGVFAYSGGQRAIVLNQDGGINGPDNPEQRGRVVTFFVTGLGAMSPAVPTGRAAPSDVLSYAVATVSARIGGVTAQVLFAGLAPGFIGLGQINVVAPGQAPAGDAVPVIFESAGQSSDAVAISIR